MIESGDTSSDSLRAECRQILFPLRNCSHILLACTHYPAILPILQDCVGNETQFVDPAGELVDRIRPWDLAEGVGDVYVTTGDPGSMQAAARSAFGWNIGDARRITL
jgi:glutamate racemase